MISNSMENIYGLMILSIQILKILHFFLIQQIFSFDIFIQQYMNCKLPDVQAGFRKGRGTRDQIANIRWIIEKAREFQKNTCCCC